MAEEKQLSKRQLEIQLAKLKTQADPNLKLEQYPVSPEAASELLYMAGFEHDDLHGRTIDLGTGTGRLAIGAALMGSRDILGVDVDVRAIELARENAKRAGVDVEFTQSAIANFNGHYDVVLMNPPYGSRIRHADIAFLDKAFQLAPTTYTIHKSSTRLFLANHIQRSGRKIDEARSLEMEIPHLFNFHNRRWKKIEIDLYRIVESSPSSRRKRD